MVGMNTRLTAVGRLRQVTAAEVDLPRKSLSTCAPSRGPHTGQPLAGTTRICSGQMRAASSSTAMG